MLFCVREDGIVWDAIDSSRLASNILKCDPVTVGHIKGLDKLSPLNCKL